jgi:deazaflavin-dependent oxidoreductase (nitroreductase family)
MGNFFVSWILRSPLHGMLSRAFLVITLRGRKTGRTISTPVNYARDGEALWITSQRSRIWWRNLRGGAEVSVRLRGREIDARALVVEPPAEVADGLRRLFTITPGMAKMYGVGSAADGALNEASLSQLASRTVQIRLTLADDGRNPSAR